MRKLLIAFVVTFLAAPLWAQQGISYEPTGRLLNDYSGILTPSQHDSLEARLVEFNDSTSNQILVILTPLLGDEEIMDLGTRIGQEWAIGEKELDNGLVIITKTKCEEEPFGDVAIVTGFGLEGVLPDVLCARIIDDYMISHLAEGDYYGAVNSALDVIEPICRGEYDITSLSSDEDETTDLIVGAVTLLIMFFLIGLPAYKAFRLRDKNYKPSSTSYSDSGGSSSSYSSSSHSSRSSSSSRSHSSSSSSHSSSRSGRGGSFGGGGSHRRF